MLPLVQIMLTHRWEIPPHVIFVRMTSIQNRYCISYIDAHSLSIHTYPAQEFTPILQSKKSAQKYSSSSQLNG